MATSPQDVQSQLAAARAAYHNLMIGRSAREVVDQNGERVTFTATNKQQLYSYIKELESQLPSAPCISSQYGPATFLF